MHAAAMDPHPENEIELSVVIPCLNEEDTLDVCIGKALQAMEKEGVSGEVIVADNGSTDGSLEIARKRGVRIVTVEEPGYGCALMGGIDVARGTYVIMGDADDSYDFLEIPKFLEKLREGFDLVQGCRLPAGGGTVLPGAMPWTHRHLGNPFFTLLIRWWFKSPIHDVYCGLRGFTKSHYEALKQSCTGMEFATEMLIKSSQTTCRISEVPITLHPDGRVSHAPHLNTWRDGWRTLRFFLINSPRWLFLAPGLLAIVAGLVGYGLGMPGVTLFGINFDLHTLLFSSLFIMCGFQSILFALLSKTYAVESGLIGPDLRLKRFYSWATLERGILISGLAMMVGVFLLAYAINEWRLSEFGALEYGRNMRLVIPGVTITALGAQLLLSSFFVSILGIQKKR
jgi:glycosyltransferase involved in cell wall biosynthesis